LNIYYPNKYFLKRLFRVSALLVSLLFFFFSGFSQIPGGYYNPAIGKNGAELQTALHNIIRNHVVRSYDYLWTAFYTTDDKPNVTVWDIYSDIPDGSANGNPPYVYYFGTNQCTSTPGYENGCYNREHSFPKSWFGGNSGDTMYTDLFHLYPTDSYVNSRRSNYPYGEVSAPTWTSLNGSKLGPCSAPGYTSTVFEPRDEYKGDFARTYFYMATRYKNVIASWQSYPGADAILNGTSYPAFDAWFLNLMIQWHTDDTVSQKEIDRNNEIYYNQQLNRNPYIDHPEYVAAVWSPGSGIKPEPSNYPGNVSGYNIHLQWTDAIGSVLPTNYLIRMSSVGFGSIVTPTDGIAVPDGPNDRNVAYGAQQAWFYGLNPNTVYYFRLFGYVTADGGIVYKTDGSVPQIQQTTQP